MTTRPAAVAGAFYPGEAETLRADIRRMLEAVAPATDPDLKALIAPHAGYIYSGPIAATAYRLLETHRERIKRVVLIGPATVLRASVGQNAQHRQLVTLKERQHTVIQ